MTSAFLLALATSVVPGGLAPAPPAAGPAVESVPDTLPRGTVRGRVTSRVSGRPVRGALVEVRTGSSYHVALTDADGRYRLERVPAGGRRLRVVALGYGELEVGVHVPAAETLAVELSLPVRPVGLPDLGIVARGAGGARAEEEPGASPAPRGSPADPERRALQAGPGVGELGLLGAARQAQRPDPGDPSGSLWVRGSTADMKRVLLDGAPVYAPFHLGGLMEAMPAGRLSSARLYLGGAPPRYDGGLSYVLDLETRAGRPERVRWSGEADMLHAGTRVEGPLGVVPGSSFLVAGRSTHGVGGDGLVDGELPYGYRDGLLRLDVPAGEAGRVSLTGFANREDVSLGRGGPGAVRAAWGNEAGSLRYRGDLAWARATVTAATGRFHTRLPFGDEPSGLATGEARQTRVMAAAVSDAGGEVDLRYGLAWDHTRTRVQARNGAGSVGPIRAEGRTASGWAGAVWRAEETVEIRAGLRGDYFTAGSEARLSPRVALAWLPSPSSRVTVSAGRYSQYVRAPESILSGDLDEWTETLATDSPALPSAASSLLSVSSADHLVLGMEHRAGGDLALGMEAFFKDFDGLTPGGSLKAAGTDLWVDWRDGGWSAWAGYSLAFAWREDRPAVPAERFSGRQSFSGGVRVPLPSGVRLEGTVAAGSGLSFEPVPFSSSGRQPLSGEQRNSLVGERSADTPFLAGAPDGSHLRLDLEISRIWPVRILGARVRVAPYLRMLNALDTRDALFYHFDGGEDLQPRSLDSVPLLPVLGVRWGM